MPKREYLSPDAIYHVYNRGVDKRKIFLDDNDYLRGIHDLFEFNNEAPSTNLNYFLNSKSNRKQSIDSRNQYIQKERKPRKLLVEILTFCFMPNHFHFLLKPLRIGGVELFMRKFGAGYANYFNQKYERSGALFQGRYKTIQISQESHFIHLPFYIHLNPLDLAFPEWRKRELKNYQKAIQFLESYRWSSYLDYIGKKNFPSVTQREFLLKFFEGPQNYKNQMEQWLKELSIENLENITLESIY